MYRNLMLSAIAGFFLLGLIDMAQATPYTYFFDVNGGEKTYITPLSGAQTADSYYKSAVAGAPTSFGTEKRAAFFWLWEDTNTNKLSLNVLFNSVSNGGYGGKANFDLSGLPSGWSWTYQDEKADFNSTLDTTPTWSWYCSFTDGGIIGGLEDKTWDIKWTLLGSEGIDRWYFLSAGAGKYDNQFTLTPGSTLNIDPKSPAPVPEPGTMILFGTGLVGLASSGRLCKKKK